MHVCLISNLYPPETLGGAEKHVRTVAERLADRGHRVSVLTTVGGGAGSPWRFRAERQAGVEVFRIAPLNAYAPYDHQEAPVWTKPFQHLVDLWNPQAYVALRRKLRALDPDVVHTHNVNGLSNATFAATDAVPCPTVHTLHDYGLLHVEPSMFVRGRIREWPAAMRPYRAIARRAAEPYVDRVLGPSRFVIEKHRQRGLFRRTRCTKVPLGIEVEGVPEGESTDADEFRVLYAGQLVEQKGVDLLVDAFRRLDGDGLRLDVLGEGPRRAALERRSAGDDRVRVHGFVPEATLDRFYAAADVTVVPSRWYENSPMVIYESYARSTPVIGARIGGIPELIEEGETGHLFEPEDRADLARTLGEASRLDPAAYEGAIARVRRELSLPAAIDRLVEVYREERADAGVGGD